jgi:uncharacterized membrane-anchored protein
MNNKKTIYSIIVTVAFFVVAFAIGTVIGRFLSDATDLSATQSRLALAALIVAGMGLIYWGVRRGRGAQ